VIGLFYQSAALYELVLWILYGRHYVSRYEALDALIEDGSTVIDLCCGPATLYRKFLKKRSVRYTGLDMNPRFIASLKNAGADGELIDLRSTTPLPNADYAIMQASLYHFLPDPKPVVDRMLAAARLGAIIAEPIRNLNDIKIKAIASAGAKASNPGSGDQPLRFTETDLDSFFAQYHQSLTKSFLIPGEREKVFVLKNNPAHTQPQSPSVGSSG
jgi:SAM-dependent methyltransferase